MTFEPPIPEPIDIQRFRPDHPAITKANSHAMVRQRDGTLVPFGPGDVVYIWPDGYVVGKEDEIVFP